MHRLASWALTAVLLAALALACAPLQARAADAGTGTRALILGADTPSHELAGHLSLLRDPSGRMTVDDVRRAGPQALKPLAGPVSLGFTSDAVWLRFVAVRSTALVPEHWWLALSHPLMHDATLYEVVGDESSGQPLLQPSGALVPAQQVPPALTDRRPVYELSLQSPGPSTYYLRLRSQSSMNLTASVWQPAAMAASFNQQSFLWGGLFGAYALVIVFYLAFWLWTHEQLHLIYVLYVLFNFLAALFTGGWAQQLWPSLSTDATITLLGFWLALPIFVGAWFSVLFLDMHLRWPRFIHHGLQVLGVTIVGVMVMVLLGHYRAVIPVAQSLSIVLIVCFFMTALHLAWRGQRVAAIFLGAFSFFYIGVAVRYLRNIGLLEPNFWTDNSYQLGAFVHMLAMSVGIFTRYGNLRRQTEEAHARVAAEVSLRSQQRDFMSMVSHEFRTPLSIIDAATHNLLHEPQLAPAMRERVLKVIRANDRMSNLMDNYLANERVLEEEETRLEPRDLLEICQDACEEQADAGGPPPTLTGPEGVLVQCDEHLLRIALSNLLSNARRHSPPDVPVAVEVQADEHQAHVFVRDRGPGIPPDEAKLIFKRFFRGRAALNTHGAGLGLYLVEVIAKRHGGTVTTRNLEPQGCEFTLSLPHLVRSAAAQALGSPRASTDPA